MTPRLGGKVAGLSFLIELANLGGLRRLRKYKSRALFTF